MRLPASPFFYPILDSQYSKDLIGDAEEVVTAGAKILQIRAKNLPAQLVFETILQLQPLCEAKDVCLIVNDFVDVAMVTSCGLHLGQEDFPVIEARKLLPDRILGLSTHNEYQLKLAADFPVDYIAIGPIFKTTSKTTMDPVLGVENVSKLRPLTIKPLVAVGGIRLENVKDLLKAGADGIAVISELYRFGTIGKSTAAFLNSIQEATL